MERLDEVIAGTGIQTGYAIFGGVARGENQGWRAIIFPAHGAQQRQTVAIGQAKI